MPHELTIEDLHIREPEPCGTHILDAEAVNYGDTGAAIRARFVCTCRPCRLRVESEMSFASTWGPDNEQRVERIGDWIERHTP